LNYLVALAGASHDVDVSFRARVETRSLGTLVDLLHKGSVNRRLNGRRAVGKRKGNKRVSFGEWSVPPTLNQGLGGSREYFKA
jgi:hypothetical protein